MPIARGEISREMNSLLSTWRHSGFHVFCGNRIQPKEKKTMENLARYIIRASFSQERMVRYYGWYSNVTGGKRQKKAETDLLKTVFGK